MIIHLNSDMLRSHIDACNISDIRGEEVCREGTVILCNMYGFIMKKCKYFLHYFRKNYVENYLS